MIKMIHLEEVLERRSTRLATLVKHYCESMDFDYFVVDKNKYSKFGTESVDKLKYINNIIKVDHCLSENDDYYMVKLNSIETILLSMVDDLKENLLSERSENDYFSLDEIEIDANIYFLNEVLRNEFR